MEPDSVFTMTKILMIVIPMVSIGATVALCWFIWKLVKRFTDDSK